MTVDRPRPCHCGPSRYAASLGSCWVCDDCGCVYDSPDAPSPILYGTDKACAELREEDELAKEFENGPVFSTAAEPRSPAEEEPGQAEEEPGQAEPKKGLIELGWFGEMPEADEPVPSDAELARVFGGRFAREAAAVREGQLLGFDVAVSLVEPLEPIAIDDAIKAEVSCSAGQGAHLSSTGQHFSRVTLEEGEKIEMEPVASGLGLDDNQVAKVGLEPPASEVVADTPKRRGRPPKAKGAQGLQSGECRDGVNGTAGQGSVGPSQQAKAPPPALGLAMAASAAQSMVEVARCQLDTAEVQTEDLDWGERLWLARAVYHLAEAARWIAVVRAFALEPIERVVGSPKVTILMAGQRHEAEVLATCGVWIAVEVDAGTESWLCMPRWVGWFDTRNGDWLADGGQPDQWSDRVTLDRSSLPAEILGTETKQ